MALSAGTRLGPYEILAAIGAGGMGEVYRARDTKLNRDVALKVLPEAFTTDPDRLARFKREAHVLAALNHPNIAAIYGFEESDGVRALVLELVEGPTLADHIANGALPVDEALHIARQMAVALEAAHEQGIIHRDLKPANMKVREDDTVKVLDFGLAKALEPAGISSNASQSPTMTSPAMTQAGIILGTAAYMSPEQAKGRATDKRSDIWAFGCTLYEMLTGRRAFEGENVSDTLAAVLRGEPDWAAFPPGVPPHVRTIVRRCLEKDRKARIPDIAVVRFMLDDASAATTTPAALDHTTTRHIGRRGWIAAALLGVGFLTASGLAAFVYFRQTPADERAIRFPIRFPVAMPNGWSLTMPFPSPGAPPVAVSPDGRRVAFVAVRQGIQHLWVRSLDSIAAQELPATEGAGGPFWDPDSRMLAFFAGDKLKRIDITGGRLLTLCDAPLPGGGAWSSEGFILFGSYGKGIQSVAAGGGVPTVVTTLAQGEAAHEKPSFLPDGRHFFYRAYTASAAIGSLYIGSIESTDRTMVKVEADATNVMYSAGYLLFLRNTTLMAQPFDLKRLVLTGEPVPVAEQVTTFASPAMAVFSASQSGVLAYRTGARAGAQLTWFDRSGKAVATLGEPVRFQSIELSPNGTQAAVTILDQDQTWTALDIWIVDVERGSRTRFTSDQSVRSLPIWSPTGDRLVFASNRDAQPGLYVKPSSGRGSEQLLIPSTNPLTPTGWSRDSLIYTAAGGKTGLDLWVLPLSGEPKPQLLLQTEFAESRGRVSPDGRWIVYVSDESRRPEGVCHHVSAAWQEVAGLQRRRRLSSMAE